MTLDSLLNYRRAVRRYSKTNLIDTERVKNVLSQLSSRQQVQIFSSGKPTILQIQKFLRKLDMHVWISDRQLQHKKSLSLLLAKTFTKKEQSKSLITMQQILEKMLQRRKLSQESKKSINIIIDQFLSYIPSFFESEEA